MLLSRANVDQAALLSYAREAADFSTNHQLPSLDFAINHYGQPDVAMFDFTCMYASENAAMVRQRHGHKLLVALVGDSLLEVRPGAAGQSSAPPDMVLECGVVSSCAAAVLADGHRHRSRFPGGDGLGLDGEELGSGKTSAGGSGRKVRNPQTHVALAALMIIIHCNKHLENKEVGELRVKCHLRCSAPGLEVT